MTNDTECSLVEKYIGLRIRERRKVLNLSQNELADLVDISYQQLQKYEYGTSAMTVSRMMKIAGALNVKTDYFYNGAPEQHIGKKIQSNLIENKRARRLNILLIEDNPADEVLFRKALGKCEYEPHVHSVQNAAAALDYMMNYKTKYAKSRPDLIILDLNLPKTGGLEILKQMRKTPSISDFPVVALTNSIYNKDLNEAYKHNISGFLQKATSFEEFSAKISDTLKYWSDTVILPDYN